MFLRTVKTRGAGGQVHEYLRLVESYWEDGTSKQRVVCNLGRKDLLAPHLEALNRILGGGSIVEERRCGAVPEQLSAIDAACWGPMLVARQLWQELGLDRTLSKLGGRGKKDGRRLGERALVLVANRLCKPRSEHGLAWWLESDFVCDSEGNRVFPHWRDEAERKQSGAPRVRVNLRWLKHWYRTLDQLRARKEDIEKDLFLRLRTLFSLQVDMVFYDLTSTYFEGQGPPKLGAHGHSRDGKPRNRQVLVGLVMVDGWPIAHHVFEGNWRDSKTVPSVLSDLKKRFGLGRVVFVGDRGMVTADNLKKLKAAKQGYVVGLTRRRRKGIYEYIQRATGPWTKCPVGITAREKTDPPKTLVQEVDSGQEGVRVFVVHSEERQQYERTQRLKAMKRVRAKLEALQCRVESGRLKAPEKVGAAAQRILSGNHGHRYYGWEYNDGQFRFFEHPVYLKREKAYEGKYLIQTEEPNISAVEAVRLYKELSEVERSFRNLKDVIEMRPIYHQTDERVEAHIFVATLAFLLHRALEKKLKAARLDLSATDALEALRTVRIVDIDLGEGQSKRSVTQGSGHARRVLKALGITKLEPPKPCQRPT
jgi:transposase